MVEKGEITRNEQFKPFSTMPSMQYVNSLVATFQLFSASSLNLGQSQNSILGNRLTCNNDIALCQTQNQTLILQTS